MLLRSAEIQLLFFRFVLGHHPKPPPLYSPGTRGRVVPEANVADCRQVALWDRAAVRVVRRSVLSGEEISTSPSAQPRAVEGGGLTRIRRAVSRSFVLARALPSLLSWLDHPPQRCSRRRLSALSRSAQMVKIHLAANCLRIVRLTQLQEVGPIE